MCSFLTSWSSICMLVSVGVVVRVMFMGLPKDLSTQSTLVVVISRCFPYLVLFGVALSSLQNAVLASACKFCSQHACQAIHFKASLVSLCWVSASPFSNTFICRWSSTNLHMTLCLFLHWAIATAGVSNDHEGW